MQVKHMGVASARKNHYQDALCGGAFCGKNNAVLLLSDEGKWSSTGQLKSKYATQFLNKYKNQIDTSATLDHEDAENENKYTMWTSTYDSSGYVIGRTYRATKRTVNYIFGGDSAISSNAITGIGNWDEAKMDTYVACGSYCCNCDKFLLIPAQIDNTKTASRATTEQCYDEEHGKRTRSTLSGDTAYTEYIIIWEH